MWQKSRKAAAVYEVFLAKEKARGRQRLTKVLN